jgi:putative endonuclease
VAPKKIWYFYVLSCKDLTFYTGVTTDVDRRVKEHNAKKGAKYTRGRTPVRLFYYREMKDRSTAQKLESAFKKLSRSKKLEKLCEMVDEDIGLI